MPCGARLKSRNIMTMLGKGNAKDANSRTHLKYPFSGKLRARKDIKARCNLSCVLRNELPQPIIIDTGLFTCKSQEFGRA